MSAMTLEDFAPTRMPDDVTFVRDGTPVPVADVVAWLRTGCPKTHHLTAALLEKHFESIAFQPFPNGLAMAAVGKLKRESGDYHLPVCVNTPYSHGELAAVGELIRTEARLSNPHFGKFFTVPGWEK
ncbi:hypothetical protein PARSHIK_280 [Erwinia phage vB_EamM_Parshik]|nr:hypothetical protein PARSHIK_280 [Erwinia phage vB_EamM_Parshik]